MRKKILFAIWLFVLRRLLSYRGIRLVVANPNIVRYKGMSRRYRELRHSVFTEKHGWEASVEEECDEFDRTSTYLLAVKGWEVIAGCRVIHRQESLPIEKLLGADVPVENGSIEISRVINTGDQTVFLAINLFVFMYARKGNFSGVYGTIRACYLKKLMATFGENLFQRLPGQVFEKRQGSHAIRFLPVRIRV